MLDQVVDPSLPTEDGGMLIDLIRHTTPDIEPGICYGQSDLGLVASFDEERANILGRVQDRYDLVVTSPLQRCSLLAEHIAGEDRRVDRRVMEYDFGDWELRPWAELRGPEAQTWMHNFVDEPAPNGESMRMMQERVLDFWTELIVEDVETVAVVTHSGVQRLLHAQVLETPLTHMFRLELAYGAVLRLRVAGDDGLATIRHL